MKMDDSRQDETGPRALTAAELAHLEEHGYVIARQILRRDDFTPLVRDYAKLVEEKAIGLKAEGKIEDVCADSDFEHRLARIAAQCSDEVLRDDLGPWGVEIDTMYALQRGCFDFFFSPRLLRAVQSIVGPEITLNPIQHLRPYLPMRGDAHVDIGAASLAPWHQDQGVTREEADASAILTCWIPLVDATAEKGCLQVIPGRVAGGLMPHVKSDYGTTIDPAVLPPDTQGVTCEMQRGDILFMNRFCPHRGTVNRSVDSVRWSIDLRFQKTGEPTGRHFWPEFVLQSPSDSQSVQDSYDEWCARWRHDLPLSKGQRWHRVAGDVGGAIARRAFNAQGEERGSETPSWQQ